MIADMNEVEIDEFLHNELIGRIGCLSDGRVYIVPISYAYDGKAIYAHTFEGEKIRAMRNHPDVCFEADNIEDQSNWKSVIAWGKFEEIKKPDEYKNALKILLDRKVPFNSSITTHLGKTWPFVSERNEKIEGIIFRIILSKVTGKFERTTRSSIIAG